MAAYEPSPLLNFDGLTQVKESFITPQNAWRALRDAFVYRGRLRKREGSTFLQHLGIETTENLTPVFGFAYAIIMGNLPWCAPHQGATYPISASDYNLRITAPWASGTMTIVCGEPQSDDGTVTVFDLVDEGTTSPTRGFVRYSPGESGDGTINVLFPNAPTATPIVTYEYASEQHVMGFHTYIGPDGTEYNISVDEDGCWLLDGTEERYYQITDIATAPEWTGSEVDVFHFGDYEDICVINNGVDVPKKFTAATQLITDMATDVDGDASDDIEAALMFFNYLGYGMYLGVKEAGTWHRGRARWTQNGNPEVFNSANDYLDAPSNDVIVSGKMVGGELFVGMRDRGWWKIEATNDAFDPFKWIPVESELGSVARNSSVAFSDRLITRNRYGFTEVNRMGERDAAPELGDIPLSWDADVSYMTQALRYDARRQVWWTFADAGEDTPQHILAMQRDPSRDQSSDKSFAIYDLPFNAVGSYRVSGTPIWNDIDEPWDDVNFSWDSAQTQGGFPTIVGGTSEGKVFAFQGKTQDRADRRAAFTPIPLRTRTIRLSPFPGWRARLGFVDIIADRASGAVLTLRFYADYASAAYKTVSVDLSGETSDEKILQRVKVNHIATFHTIEIEDAGTSAIAIDYLAPWFKREGRIREVL